MLSSHQLRRLLLVPISFLITVISLNWHAVNWPATIEPALMIILGAAALITIRNSNSFMRR
jgi:hypothetical protein